MPKATPPSESCTNFSTPSPTEYVPRSTAVSAIENATRPMPSLTRLSASRIVRSFAGADVEPMIDVALTGSVGPSTAPSTKAPPAPIAATAAQTAAPTAKSVAAVRPNARSRIESQFSRTSRGAVRNAAE